MTRAAVTFDFLSYWHLGSGRGAGASFDSVVIRSPEELPFIPGRTVKGLFREAVYTLEECGEITPGVTEKLFGTAPSGKQDGGGLTRYQHEPGSLRFFDAQLPPDFRAWAVQHKKEASFLFVALSATKIDECGLASDKSLRRVEACIPLRLTGYVEANDAEAVSVGMLTRAASFIRAVGSHRHRGLGRVKVAVQVQEVKR